MIDLFYFPSPNGLKIAIMLEECGLPYEVVPIDIGSGEQFRPEYLALNPNNKIPTIVNPVRSSFISRKSRNNSCRRNPTSVSRR